MNAQDYEEIINKAYKNRQVDDDTQRKMKDIIIKAKHDNYRALHCLRCIKNQNYLEEIADKAFVISTRKLAVNRIKDQAALKRVAFSNSSPSTRIIAIERIEDIDFLTKMYRHEKNRRVKKALWALLVSNTSTIPKLSKEEIIEIHSKKDLNAALSAIDNPTELKQIALNKNPAKRIAKEIPKIKSSSLLKFIILYNYVNSNNVQEWTELIAQLPKNDLEIAKRIMFDKEHYGYRELDKITDEDKLCEIALESNDDNIVFYCVSKIKNRDLLKKIANKTNDQFIYSHIENKLKKRRKNVIN